MSSPHPGQSHRRSGAVFRAVLGILAVSLAALAGCSEEETPEGTIDGPGVPVKVMTRNLYLGADLTSLILTATPEEIPARVGQFWSTVLASEPAARMARLAEEIAAVRPDLVALQEVELYRTQSPSDFDLATPAPPNASEVALDFLQVLLGQLQALGVSYTAIENPLTDTEMPADVGGSRIDVRLTDREVILVRPGLVAGKIAAKTFETHLPLRIGGERGVPVKLVRGLLGTEITGAGLPFFFVASHLEAGGPARLVQEAQAGELVAALAAFAGTLVLAGDFNSPADNTGTTSHSQIAAVLRDAWAQARPADPGFTCCTPLEAPVFTATARSDLVFFRGAARVVAADLSGTEAALKTATGRWPSDHAGVSVTFELPAN